MSKLQSKQQALFECLKAGANGFNICFNIRSPILLNTVEHVLMNDVEDWGGKRFQHLLQHPFDFVEL